MGGAGAGRVSPQRAAARCLYESSSRALGEGRDPSSSQQGEARTISRENAPPRLYTVPPHSLFAILMNLNKGYALYGGLQTYGLNLKQPCKAIRNQL